MKQLLRSLIKYPLVPLFGVLVCVMFCLYLLLPAKEFSQEENRLLQTMPEISVSALADGSFMSKFETYTTEQLPFRTALVNVKAYLNRMSLSIENNGIVKGENGYLFEKTYGISGQYDKNVKAMVNFVKDADRTICIAIAPNASEIYPEYMPYGMNRIHQQEALERLYTQLEDDSNANIVNITNALNTHKDEYLYYRTDHHWTTNAAYYGYLSIREALGCENKSVDIKSIPSHERDDFYGTLYAKYKAGSVDADVLTYFDIPVASFERSDGTYSSLYDTEQLNLYDKYAVFLRGNDEICTIQADNGGKGELIVFKDSYANCLIPFLTYDYDTIRVVDLRYYNESVSQLLSDHPDADVLLLYNFSFVNEDNHFYRLTS